MSLFEEYEPKLQVRKTDPETSAKAAMRLKPHSAKAALLGRYYLFDLSDEQAAEQVGMTIYEASKRCSDLRRDGFIEPVKIGVGSSGHERMICRITENGRAAVFHLRAKNYGRSEVERPRRSIDGEL